MTEEETANILSEDRLHWLFAFYAQSVRYNLRSSCVMVASMVSRP